MRLFYNGLTAAKLGGPIRSATYGTPIDHGSDISRRHVGFLACVALIAAAISKDDPVFLAQVTNSVFVSVRMFVVGAAVPTVAWGIAALEFDRSHTKKRLLTSATMYALLDIVLRCRMAPSASIPREPANYSRIQRRSLTLAVSAGSVRGRHSSGRVP